MSTAVISYSYKFIDTKILKIYNVCRDQQQERKGGPLGYLDSERYIKTIKKKIVHHDVNYSKRAKDVVSLSQKMTNHQQQFEQHMKSIEDHMWKHKQEERELKRAEGDIIKSQQTLRRTMRVIEKCKYITIIHFYSLPAHVYYLERIALLQ